MLTVLKQSLEHYRKHVRRQFQLYESFSSIQNDALYVSIHLYEKSQDPFQMSFKSKLCSFVLSPYLLEERQLSM